MKVAVIGASGLVGSHCMNIMSENGIEVLGTHFSFSTENTHYFNALEGNISEYFISKNFQPDLIIHCAALTNVDFCEKHPSESYEQTVAPTLNIVDYCNQFNIKIVYISTDYIFDGIDGPYSEMADVNPINIYGKHKLECELLVSTVKSNLILRITNVYGEEIRNKNFIARLIIQLINNEDKVLDLPKDQYATPIYAGDIAEMILILIKDNREGIYNLSSTDYYSRYQLAKKIKSYFLNNKSVLINPVETINTNQTAKRPLNGGLINNKFSNQYPYFQFTNVDSYIKKSLKNEL